MNERHQEFRDKALDEGWNKKERSGINVSKDIMLRFTYTLSLARLGSRFHQIWQEIFEKTSLSNNSAVFAQILTNHFKSILLHKKPPQRAVKAFVAELE